MAAPPPPGTPSGATARPAPAQVWTTAGQARRSQLEGQLRQSPNDASCLCALAALLCKHGAGRDAAPLLARARLAAGNSNEVDDPTVLRKLAGAHVSLWRATRATPQGHVNGAPARYSLLDHASEFYDQALGYPENAASPASLSEAAVCFELRGELRDALAQHSSIVSSFPLWPGVHIVIWRCAVLLKHLGDVPQATHYMEYIVDMPPVEAGYSLMHVTAMLSSLYAAAGNTVKAAQKLVQMRSLYEAVAPAAVRAPPHGTAFADWSGPWAFIGREACDRSDYALAAEAYSEAVDRERTAPELWLALAESLNALGEEDRALAAAEAGHALDTAHQRLRDDLCAWAPAKWRPLLIEQDARRLEAANKHKLADQKIKRREAMGNAFAAKRHHKQRVFYLGAWLKALRDTRAAVACQRRVRGFLARKLAARLATRKVEVGLAIRKSVLKINGHLLAAVLREWNRTGLADSRARAQVAGPMVRRAKRRALARGLAAWLDSIQTWREIRRTVRKAMANAGNGYPLYAKALVTLAAFPEHKAGYERRNKTVLEQKALAKTRADLASSGVAVEMRLPQLGASLGTSTG